MSEQDSLLLFILNQIPLELAEFFFLACSLYWNSYWYFQYWFFDSLLCNLFIHDC